MPSDWERVAGDPVLLAAVRSGYAGSGDALDQLRWLDRPGERTPEGVEDPALALAAARAALYSPDAEHAAAERVERLTALIAADRAEARRALEHADAHLRRPAAPSPAKPPARVGIGLLVGAVVAALLFGAGAGFAAGRFTSVPRAEALTVFDRPQRTDDQLPSSASLPRLLVRSSLRLVGSSTTTGTSVYGARTGDGGVCLLAVVLAADAVASCTSEAAFAVSGLSLSFEASADPEDDSGPSQPRELDPHWTADGAFTF